MKQRLFIVALLLILATLRYATGHVLGLHSLQEEALDHWQLLDLALLQHDLLRSLLDLHSQPPLLNLLVGFCVKLAGAHYYEAFIFLNCLMAAGITLLLYRMALRCGLPRNWAMAAATVFYLSPATFLHQAFVFYPMLTALLFTGLASSMVAWLTERRPAALAVSVICFSLLCLTRSSYHPALFLVFLLWAGWAAWRTPGLRVRPAAALIVGLAALLPFALIVKNGERFGVYGASSWTSMNLARVLISPDNTSAPLLRIGTFEDPQAYAAISPPRYVCQDFEGHPALTDTRKNGGNYWNMNYCGLIQVNRDFGTLVREHLSWPTYVRAVAVSAIRWLSNPDGYELLLNREGIRAYADGFNLALNGSFSFLGSVERLTRLHPFVEDVVRIRWWLVLALALYVLRALCLIRQQGPVSGSLAIASSCHGVLLIMVGLHFGLHVFTDGRESDRFVFELEPVLWVLMLGALHGLRGSLPWQPFSPAIKSP